jgi:photosystem I P700 chlorophyll a apoprotein A2
MATRFPKFSQVLSEDPTTRRIWYSIGQHMTLKVMMMLLKKLYQKIFASHFGHLAIIFFGQQVIYST